jgi:AraC-like DNA-binding protein
MVRLASMTVLRETEDARAWRCADLGGVELFRATVREFAFRPHAHEEFFIALTDAGTASPTYRGDKHVVGPGDLIVMNPEEAHAGGPLAGVSWTYRALYPSLDLMRQITAGLPSGLPVMPWFATDVVRDLHVATRLHRFHQLSESPRSNALQRETHLAEGLVSLAGRYARFPRAAWSPGREPRAVQLARDYLHEHAEDNVTLRDLAQHAGLAPYHLCRVFRQATGMAPHAYQIQVRVRRAKNLLLAGRPIAQAAAEAGFWDQAHLTRHFKRVVGLSPGRYVAGIYA